VLEKQFEQAVNLDRWSVARKILIEVRRLMADVSPRAAQRVNGSITRMADKRHFEHLSQYLNTNPQVNLEPIRDLLSLSEPPRSLPSPACSAASSIGRRA
jgi:hypothetical protein